MNKSEKGNLPINALHEKMRRSKAAFVAAVGNLSQSSTRTPQSSCARRCARRASTTRSWKNTLARARRQGHCRRGKLEKHFAGPVAVAIGYDDMVQSAKALTEFIEEPRDAPDRGAVATAADRREGVKTLGKMPGLRKAPGRTPRAHQPAGGEARSALIAAPGSQLARVVRPAWTRRKPA